jgi:hypothetical protein
MPATLLQMTYDRDLRQTDDAISLRNIRDHTPTELVREMAQRLLAAGGYWAVGEFDTEDPEQVWLLSQNGRRSPSWSRQPPPGVKPLGDGTVFGGYGYQDSCMGDIVVIGGHCHIAVTFGFEDIGELPVPLASIPRPRDTGSRRQEPEVPAGPRM